MPGSQLIFMYAYVFGLIIFCKANTIRSTVIDRRANGCKGGSHWSEWIDRHSPKNSFGDEHESMIDKEFLIFCNGGTVTNIECYSSSESFLETGQEGTCNVERGLVCRHGENSPHGCRDFRVRYYCQCAREAKARVVRSHRYHCPEWSTWYNDHTPTTTDRGDKESKTRTELEQFCPSSNGKHVTAASCKDRKGEAYTGPVDKPEYKATCDLATGLICTPKSSYRCGDFSIRYCCADIPTSQATSTMMTTIPFIAAALISTATTEPVTIPTPPVTLPTQPLTKSTPATIPTPPVTLPTQPLTKSTPVTIPIPPVTLPTQPLTKSTPVTIPTPPVTLPTQPLTKSTPATIPTPPVTLPTPSITTAALFQQSLLASLLSRSTKVSSVASNPNSPSTTPRDTKTSDPLSRAREIIKEKYYSVFGTKFNIWIALFCASIVLSVLHCFLTYYAYKKVYKLVKNKRSKQRHVHPMNVKW